MEINEELLNDVQTYLQNPEPLLLDLKEIIMINGDVSEVQGSLKLLKFEQDNILDGNSFTFAIWNWLS